MDNSSKKLVNRKGHQLDNSNGWETRRMAARPLDDSTMTLSLVETLKTILF